MATREVTIELLTDATNAAVHRLPPRRYPGILVQGDSLAAMVGMVRRARAATTFEVAREEVDELATQLERLLASYETALTAAGIELPYARESG
jgi:hypothetical protein